MASDAADAVARVQMYHVRADVGVDGLHEGEGKRTAALLVEGALGVFAEPEIGSALPVVVLNSIQYLFHAPTTAAQVPPGVPTTPNAILMPSKDRRSATGRNR
ncbi:MAG: hypothetical protein IIB25_13120 [Chloroflexi bacterium]|nr:hypothetical protein [Chloroflexota bacterium]